MKITITVNGVPAINFKKEVEITGFDPRCEFISCKVTERELVINLAADKDLKNMNDTWGDL